MSDNIWEHFKNVRPMDASIGHCMIARHKPCIYKLPNRTFKVLKTNSKVPIKSHLNPSLICTWWKALTLFDELRYLCCSKGPIGVFNIKSELGSCSCKFPPPVSFVHHSDLISKFSYWSLWIHFPTWFINLYQIVAWLIDKGPLKTRASSCTWWWTLFWATHWAWLNWHL